MNHHTLPACLTAQLLRCVFAVKILNTYFMPYLFSFILHFPNYLQDLLTSSLLLFILHQQYNLHWPNNSTEWGAR